MNDSCPFPFFHMFEMYFCGQDEDCGHVDRLNMVDQALKNLVTSFTMVGIMEEFETSLKLFEIKIPEYFTGAPAVWSRLKDTAMMDTATKRKDSLRPDVREVLRQKLDGEYRIYNTTKILFERMKREAGL